MVVGIMLVVRVLGKILWVELMVNGIGFICELIFFRIYYGLVVFFRIGKLNENLDFF